MFFFKNCCINLVSKEDKSEELTFLYNNDSFGIHNETEKPSTLKISENIEELDD